ncbi:MAG: S4 domain-containing protein [Pseudomonadota bacterium]
MADKGEDDTLRLDIWLWRARFFKTRALASAHINKRGVRVSRHGQTRRVDKPGATVTAGDVLTFTRTRIVHVIEIAGLGERRGPADESRTLYIDLSGDEEDGAANV